MVYGLKTTAMHEMSAPPPLLLLSRYDPGLTWLDIRLIGLSLSPRTLCFSSYVQYGTSTYHGQVRRDIDQMVRGRYRLRGDDDNRASVAITRQNIDQVAEKHFPLCMRRTLRVLRQEHHLKYEARVQLVSFLCNAGMEVT